jgi:hypothetical protein
MATSSMLVSCAFEPYSKYPLCDCDALLCLAGYQHQKGWNISKHSAKRLLEQMRMQSSACTSTRPTKTQLPAAYEQTRVQIASTRRCMQPPFSAERVETDGELHVTRARRSTTQPLRTAHRRRQCDTSSQRRASHSLTERPTSRPRLPQHLHALGCRAANPRSRRRRFCFRTSIAFGGVDQHGTTEHYGAPVANLSRRID